MQTELQPSVFDYEILDCKDADRVFLKGKEEVIKSRTAQTVIENGRDLLEAKERVGHGNFEKWVEGVFPWSKTTAHRMMKVAESFKSSNIGRFENIQRCALFSLSAPSTPEAARAEALELAAAGEKITHKQAQQIIQSHIEVDDLVGSTATDLQGTLPEENNTEIIYKGGDKKTVKTEPSKTEKETTEGITEKEFRRKYNAFLKVVQSAKLTGWQTVPYEMACNCIGDLNNQICQYQGGF